MFSALGRWASPPSHPRPPRNSGATAFPAFGQSSAGDKPRRGPYVFESGRSVTPESVRTDDGLGVSQEGGWHSTSPSRAQMRPSDSSTQDNAADPSQSSDTEYMWVSTRPPAGGWSKAFARRYPGAVSSVRGDERSPGFVDTPTFGGGLTNSGHRGQCRALSHYRPPHVETAPPTEDGATDSTIRESEDVSTLLKHSFCVY